MVKFAVEFWWKMLLTIFPANEARKSPSKLRRKFATNFAENFANFTLEIAGAYNLQGREIRVRDRVPQKNLMGKNSPVRMIMLILPGRSYGPGGPKKVELKALHSRHWYED